jgi:hypothetical protein
MLQLVPKKSIRHKNQELVTILFFYVLRHVLSAFQFLKLLLKFNLEVIGVFLMVV